MKDAPISSKKLLVRLKSYMRSIEQLNRRVTEIDQTLARLSEDVADDLVFLEHEIEQHRKRKRGASGRK